MPRSVVKVNAVADKIRLIEGVNKSVSVGGGKGPAGEGDAAPRLWPRLPRRLPGIASQSLRRTALLSAAHPHLLMTGTILISSLTLSLCRYTINCI